VLASREAASQGFPDRTVKLIVGVAPGASSDLMARVLAEALESKLGQRVIVENRAGADGIIAVGHVASAPPDGYTLLFGFGSQFAINPVLYAKLPYDPERDLAPVSLVALQSWALAVHPSVPVTSAIALADYSRAHPGTLSYGAGTSTFMLGAESFKQRTGADMLHVPFNGSAPVVTALVGGTVQVGITTAFDLLANEIAGKVRTLAVSGSKRFPAFPDVPTFAELGLGDDVPVWTAVFAPAGTPPGVVGRLNAAIVSVLNEPSVRTKFESAGQTVVGSTPEELAARAARDRERMGALVKRIGLPLR
jgi:tripartite-type tricarboxylate transporter receptor subunit TctC